MAKCPICTIRKGKRKCLISDNQFICSLCCGSTRKEELCSSCVFYQPPQHDYEKVPAFSVSAVANNHALQSYSRAIETALGADSSQDKQGMLELLMNKYFFKDEEIRSENAAWLSGFNAADAVIQTELKEVDQETLVNVLGAMRLALLS